MMYIFNFLVYRHIFIVFSSYETHLLHYFWNPIVYYYFALAIGSIGYDNIVLTHQSKCWDLGILQRP